MTRRGVIPLLAAAVVLIGAAPASPPDHPVAFIKVDELKALLDKKTKAAIIDVRTMPEYAELHIKGARSIPLRVVGERAPKAIPKQGLVVLY